jgi:hypothetical protein
VTNVTDNPRRTGVDSAFVTFDGGGEAKNQLVETPNVVDEAARIIDSFSWRERPLIANSLFSA